MLLAAVSLLAVLPAVAYADEGVALSADDTPGIAAFAADDGSQVGVADGTRGDAPSDSPVGDGSEGGEPSKTPEPVEPQEPMHKSVWAQVDGVWKYFDAKGEAIATATPGWMDVEGKRQYIDGSGKPVFDSWALVGESWYWLGDDGVPASGWAFVNEHWYYLAQDGKMETGWVNPYGDAWYWLSPSGAMGEGWLWDRGDWYYLMPESGRMQTGWYKVNDEWNWSDSSGAWHEGRWVRQNGRWWYSWPNGDYPVGSVEKINGHYYAFDDSGWMLTGWYYDGAEGNWLYLDPVVGNALTGWYQVDDEWFYTDSDYRWVPNSWEYVDGTWYLRWATGGRASDGWEKMGGEWYLFAGDGSMLTGWQSVDGRWYYLTPSGRMATGWVQDNGKWYYLNDGGSMRTGWIFSGGEWYFLDNTGAWNLEDPEMTAYAQGFSSATDWLILIDTKENQLGVFRGSYGNWKCEYLWRCSCGTAWTPTVLGTYSVTGRGYSFGSSTYTCYYYTQFWGDYLIHSVIYYKNGTVEDALGRGLSQGCVRLDINNAKWVYDNIPNGTKVYNY